MLIGFATALPFLIFTYFLSGCVLFLALNRLVRLPVQDVPRLFWLSLGVGPAAVSWLVVIGVKLVPGLPHLAYIALVEIVFVSLAALGWRTRGSLQTVFSDLHNRLRALPRWTWFERFMGLLLLGVFCADLFFALILPITENDAIQYVLVSGMMYERSSVAFYPVIEPDPQSGFYAVSSHPIGFMGLYLWTFMAQGGTGSLSLIKLASPAFVFFTLLALTSISWEKSRLVAFTSALILLATPVYFFQSTLLSIDSFRIYLLVVAAVWLFETAVRGNKHAGLRWAAGLFCGFSMFSHSINLVFTVPLLGLGYLAVANGPIAKRLNTIIVVALVAIVVGGERIASNLLQFGMPVYDFLPVYELSFLRYADHVWGSAGMVTSWDRVTSGVLRSWTDLRSFGLSYWIFLAALSGWAINWPTVGWVTGLEKMQVVVVGAFLLLAAATVAMGSPVFVTNARYLVTVQPFIASVGALFLITIYERYRDRT